MTTLARDVSNFTVPLTAAMIQQWKAEGVGLTLIQAFPPSYAQYTEQRAQMRVCAAEGMPFDCYVYDYLGDPTWLWAALDGLDQVLLPSEKPRQLWLDEEDTETERGWTRQQRESTIAQRLIDTMDRGWVVDIYTAAWWWTPRVGAEEFVDHKLWAAQYDGVADASVFTPFGGWRTCAIKQYMGSQPDGTDLNVLSAEEEAELTSGGDPDVTDEERQQLQGKIDSLINSLGYIAGDVLRPLTRKGAAAYVKTAVAAIREQADQQGISHA